jgi:hypothetical protein
VGKIICIIFISMFVLLSGTALAANDKSNDKGNEHNNGYGYGRGIGQGIGNGILNGNGFGLGNEKVPDNGYGFGQHGVPGTNAPEPISSALFALGGVGLGLYRKFKNKD